jgi:hypothetical protein
MRSSADIAAFIESEPEMMRLLAVVRTALPDAWIGAGFVRNAVWDALSRRRGVPLDDVDVVLIDPADPRPARDAAAQADLERLCPGVPWQVKNQARMHGRNGDAPYHDISDAIARWPETATAIAARAGADRRVELTAPHGVDDLLGLIVRPTPAFALKLDVYRDRVRRKNWLARWPELTILGMD